MSRASIKEIRDRYRLTKMESHKTQMVILGVRLMELGIATYRDYLKSDHWSQVRAKWHRCHRGAKCESCHLSLPLQLHHRIYNNLGYEKMKDLMGLCDHCHNALHAMAKMKRTIRLDMPPFAQAKSAQFIKQFSRTVRNSRSPAVALMNQHAASSPATDQCHTGVTRTGGMASPEVIPAGRSTSSMVTSHSDCLANATPVNGETTHKSPATLEAALTVVFGNKSR